MSDPYLDSPRLEAARQCGRDLSWAMHMAEMNMGHQLKHAATPDLDMIERLHLEMAGICERQAANHREMAEARAAARKEPQP